MSQPTARDDLGVLFIVALAAAYLLVVVTFVGSHAPTVPAPGDTVTGDTAAPAVIYTGVH